jgi:sec-independent protein translocase protein TatC
VINGLAKEMGILEHLQELKDRVIRIAASIIIVSIFAFAVSLKPVKIAGYSLILPIPDPFANIASQVITAVGDYQLPSYVKFIMTAPAQAIIAEIYVAVFLGVVISMPVIIREVAAFVNPALYSHERKAIMKLILPATVLFIGGCIFSYFWITPFTIDFLYRYGLAIGNVATYIALDDFITFVLLFVIAFGLSFELPIIMWIITKAGIVEAKFWMKYFRYAVVAMVVYGAAITPDGSGITMWFVALPMIVLYLGGYLFSRRIKKT